MPVVSLREVNRETVEAICQLSVAEKQQKFVKSNAESIAEAYFTREAWFRAIYADEEPVGFMMLFLVIEPPRAFLWRFMIDVRHQGRGYGRQAIARVIDSVRSLSQAEFLETSYLPGPGCPKAFYERLGFHEVGEHKHGQRLMRLDLCQSGV